MSLAPVTIHRSRLPQHTHVGSRHPQQEGVSGAEGDVGRRSVTWRDGRVPTPPKAVRVVPS